MTTGWQRKEWRRKAQQKLKHCKEAKPCPARVGSKRWHKTMKKQLHKEE